MADRIVRGSHVAATDKVHVVHEPQEAVVEHTAAAPVVVPEAERVVVREPVAVASDQTVERTWYSFSASQVVHGLCGAVLLLLGAIAVARAGFDAPAEEEVEVLGITLTTVLGLVLLAAGLLLVIAALTPSGRPFGGFVGVVLAVAGLVLAAGSAELLADAHTDRALGWVLIVIGALSLLGAFLPEHTSARRYVRSM